MMTLTADSGATKTLWYWGPSESPQYCITAGCHPYYRTTAELVKSLTQELLPNLPSKAPQQVHLYGAGCGHLAAKRIVEAALRQLFPTAIIAVESDLVGAARGTAGRAAGICCILGTGSASGYFEQGQLKDQVPSLGYLLGDEGGGASLGRALLQAYFYRHFPTHLKAAFEAHYAPDRHAIIRSLLNGPEPSRTLGNYALFAAARGEDVFIQQLVRKNFDAFLQGQVAYYAKADTVPIHAVGSLVYGFASIWRQAVHAQGWTVGRISKTPFPDLLAYS